MYEDEECNQGSDNTLVEKLIEYVVRKHKELSDAYLTFNYVERLDDFLWRT